MALQSALSRLRTATVTTHCASSNENPAYVTPTPPPVFRLEDADKDLFSLSDDEFLSDQSIFCSPPCVTGDQASNGEGTAKLCCEQTTAEKKDQYTRDDVTRCHGQNEPSDHRQFQTSKVATGSNPAPPSPTPTSNSPANSIPRNSPAACTSSLERLRAFKFVSAPAIKKGGARRAEEGDGSLPPAKRRSVGDDVTNTGWSVDEEGEPALRQSRGRQQIPSSAGELVDRTGDPLPQDCGLESEIGNFLTGVERDPGEYFIKAALTTECSSTPSPSPFKIPLLRPPGLVSATSSSHHAEPHRTSSVLNRRTLPITSASSSVSKRTLLSDTGACTPTRNNQVSNKTSTLATAAPRSQFQKTPQEIHLTNAITASCDVTPRGSLPSSAVASSTPKNRFASQAGTSTPIFQTPSSARRPAKRKFPGPAGLLPALVSEASSSLGIAVV